MYIYTHTQTCIHSITIPESPLPRGKQTVTRTNFLLSNFSRVETIDGSAVEGEDYLPVNEILTFEPEETEKEVITPNNNFATREMKSIDIIIKIYEFVFLSSPCRLA